MKKIPGNLSLIVLIGISLSFLITAVYADDVGSMDYIRSSSSTFSAYTVRATSDNNILFFDNNHGTVPWTYNTGLDISAIAISDDGNYVAAGCEGGRILFFNKNGEILWRKTIGNSFITAISISADNQFVDLTTDSYQVFYITREGMQIDSSVRWPEVITFTPAPELTQRAVAVTTAAPAPTLPEKTDPPTDSGYTLFIWLLIVPVAIGVFLFILRRPGKTHPGRVPTPPQPPPQQLMTILAQSVPDGADIYVNGVHQGIAPVTVRNLPPGLYTLKASLDGHAPDTQKISITSEQPVWQYTSVLRKIPEPQSQVNPVKKSRKIRIIRQEPETGSKDNKEE